MTRGPGFEKMILLIGANEYRLGCGKLSVFKKKCPKVPYVESKKCPKVPYVRGKKCPKVTYQLESFLRRVFKNEVRGLFLETDFVNNFFNRRKKKKRKSLVKGESFRGEHMYLCLV